MIVYDIKEYDSAYVVVTKFESDQKHIMEMGRQPLTARWHAAAKQLISQNQLKDAILVQVHAGIDERLGLRGSVTIYEQDVTFFLEKL